MLIEDVKFYHAAKYGPVLPEKLVRQLAALAQRVLKVDGRDESIAVDENGRFLTAQTARVDGVALVEDGGRVDHYLIELNNDAA